MIVKILSAFCKTKRKAAVSTPFSNFKLILYDYDHIIMHVFASSTVG